MMGVSLALRSSAFHEKASQGGFVQPLQGFFFFSVHSPWPNRKSGVRNKCGGGGLEFYIGVGEEPKIWGKRKRKNI